MQTYNIRRYEESVRQAGLAYMQFPIVEMAPPDSLPATQALVAAPPTHPPTLCGHAPSAGSEGVRHARSRLTVLLAPSLFA